MIGTFQIMIPVSTKTLLLPEEESNLSVFRWIAKAIPKNNRWYPVFERYLLQLADRVHAFGGEPARIAPSPLGDGKPWHPGKPGHPGGPGQPGHGEPGRGEPGHEKHEHEEEFESIGKVSGLIYDRFGDFEGFFLETMYGERHRYDSREREIQALACRAWGERLRVAVHAPMHHPHSATRIVLESPPAHV